MEQSWRRSLCGNTPTSPAQLYRTAVSYHRTARIQPRGTSARVAGIIQAQGPAPRGQYVRRPRGGALPSSPVSRGSPRDAGHAVRPACDSAWPHVPRSCLSARPGTSRPRRGTGLSASCSYRATVPAPEDAACVRRRAARPTRVAAGFWVAPPGLVASYGWHFGGGGTPSSSPRIRARLYTKSIP